jgi:transcriptional regulator with GAF, ATPase, and Fis domain
MNSTSGWEREEIQETTVNAVDHAEQESTSNITKLKELTMTLLREVHSITEVHQLSFDHGLDFYDEVSRFEIDLIKRALFQTGGHQGRAAKLLNLKVTTLNSKIKHYNISLAGFSNGYPVIEAKGFSPRQVA